MVTLTAARTEIKDALNAASIKAIDYVAETITPPVAIVVPGAPYLSRPEGQVPFGVHQVSIQVLLLAGTGTNKTTAEALDRMIERAVVALDDWDLTEVSQPGQVALNGSNYLGTVISIETDIKLEGA